METIQNEHCPICNEKKLSLSEDEMDIPFFGLAYVFGMTCSGCGFHKSDVEAAESREPVKVSFTIANSKDLNIRVVKSSEAAVKIPQLKMEMQPGPDSIGFVSNVEGLLKKFKEILESERDSTDDEDVRKSAKNLLKKLWKVECGEQELKIIIEDPSGNSAIISDKAVTEKLAGKKK